MKTVNDFYCDEVFSGKTKVKIVHETGNVLAFFHTKPYFPVHIIVTPKKHISSLLELEDGDMIIEILGVIKSVASDINKQYGSCKIITNLGDYQDSKHLHFHIIHGNHEDL